MKIAILGTRGIPARYGGFETFAQELAVRLADRGHKITVYCRKSERSELFSFERYQAELPYLSTDGQILLRFVPTFYHKYLETICHSLVSFLDCSVIQADLIILCNAANSPWIPLARLRGIPVAVNVDGVERKRAKWNLFGQIWYRLGEVCSVLFASRIISDAMVISEYYRKNYACPSEVIAYGAERQFVLSSKMHAEFNLIPKKYLLYVSRLEPENNCLGVIRAYLQSEVQMPLVIVGDAPYAENYKKQLHAEAGRLQTTSADRRVVFTGFRFGESYRELREHCYLYIQATEVGGTHPALVEAMMHANCILANDVPEHREVLQDAGLYYNFNDFSGLSDLLQRLSLNPEFVTELGDRACKLAREKYSWDKITDKYENLCYSLVKAGNNHQ